MKHTHCHTSLTCYTSHLSHTSLVTHLTAPPPPTIVEIVPVSSTALFLSWRLEGRVPGVLAGYNVTYMRNESVNVQGFIELGPNK